MQAHYTTDFKKKAIYRYEQGAPLKLLSQELQVSLSALYQWRKEYCSVSTPTHTYTPAELDSLTRRLKKLEHELEIIRGSGLLAAVPLQNRLAILENQYHQEKNAYSVHELCDALEVARGTFYNHIFRRADRSHKDAEQERLMMLVQQVFDDSKQRYGADKIRATLAQSNIHIGVKRVSAIMRELGLRSIRATAKKDYQKRSRDEKRNLLQRSFTASHPNQIWVSDITYFRVQGYWVYLCIILDLYSRKIVGYHVSKNASTHLVTTTFKRAYEERGKPKHLTFHSDRGSQYTSGAFTKILRQNGIKQSFSASGSPHDNAVAETFFASFKKEEAYRRDYTSEQNFCKSVDQYISFYNEKRPHWTLRYLTPQAFEDAYYAKSENTGKACANQSLA